MRRSKFPEEQIIGMLTEHEAGLAAADLCRKYGIRDATFYKWREVRRHAGVGRAQAEGARGEPAPEEAAGGVDAGCCDDEEMLGKNF
jgi:putative transposase